MSSLRIGPVQRIVALTVLVLVAITLVSWGSSQHHSTITSLSTEDRTGSLPLQNEPVEQVALKGHAIAPKLGNETAKAELGRAAWKLFHTMMARFPDEPTTDEKTALKSYIHLFQRLYPCGECAEHFGVILEKFPPQVATRSVAAGWACHVHNEVNKSLNKELFDCANIGDFYDCGCADEEKGDQGTTQESVASNPLSKDGESGKGTNNPDTGDRNVHKHHPNNAS